MIGKLSWLTFTAILVTGCLLGCKPNQVEATGLFLLGEACTLGLGGLDGALRDLGAGRALGRVRQFCQSIIDHTIEGYALEHVDQIRGLVDQLGSRLSLTLTGRLPELADNLIDIASSLELDDNGEDADES